jgi:hypothetical protein
MQHYDTPTTMKISLFKIKALSVYIIFACTLSLGCNNQDHGSESRAGNSSASLSDYQDAEQTLEERESANPTEFLSTKGTYRKNLIDQWVLEGTIKSSAKSLTYKDIVLEIVHYSKTGSVIGREQSTIYEFVRPGERISFKIKTNGYNSTSSIGWEVVDAKAE